MHPLKHYRTGRRGARGRAPTVSDAVGALKRLVNRRLGQELWQRSFHEHVIRNETDYREIWDCIDKHGWISYEPF